MFSFPFLLTIYAGFTHAFEADHLLAVSSIVSQRSAIRLSVKDGVYWGLGHASTIFLIGILMILFKATIPPVWFHYFEAAVGFMLIALAVFRAVRFFRKEGVVVVAHSHPHLPDHSLTPFHPAENAFEYSGSVTQPGLPADPVALQDAEPRPHRWAMTPQKKYTRNLHLHFSEEKRPGHHPHSLAYGIGLIHGLAGSGALVLVVMSQIKSPVDGLVYLGLFGLACTVGMMVAALLFSIPFSKRLIQGRVLQTILVLVSCLLCLVYGGKVVIENIAA
ncbi:hypothetical protein ACX0G9_10250 [Flavitalea flava]